MQVLKNQMIRDINYKTIEIYVIQIGCSDLDMFLYAINERDK
jgi:hypothetical protein